MFHSPIQTFIHVNFIAKLKVQGDLVHLFRYSAISSSENSFFVTSCLLYCMQIPFLKV